MGIYDKIDLHMHTTVSDGTDTPKEITARVKEAGITLFSVTDHDASEGGSVIESTLKKGDPAFIYGVEFSCKDEEGRYHVLGYGYDAQAPSIRELINTGHNHRMNKLMQRLDFLQSEFGFIFSDDDKNMLLSLDNPGKPHIGNLMVKYGYAQSKEEAIEIYINKHKSKEKFIRPEEAISAVLEAHGIPVLAHPSYGRGDELIIGDDMDKRLKKLTGFGLLGVEAFYSGFTAPLQKEVLRFAEKYDLYVTAGSDYHGKNKLVMLADTNLGTYDEYPERLRRFLKDVRIIDPNTSK